MKRSRVLYRAAAALVAIVAAVAPSAAGAGSGFLADYSRLEAVDGDASFDRVYVAPEALASAAGFDRVLIVEPEIYLAPDSPYEGLKADSLALLSDSLVAAVAESLTGAYALAETAGPGVLVLRLALVDLYLKKPISKNPLHYTPAGFVIKTARFRLQDDLSKKVSLVEAGVELEVVDGETGAVLAAATSRRGTRKDETSGAKADPTSWEEIDAIFASFGKRVACRLDNARKPPEQWARCAQL